MWASEKSIISARVTVLGCSGVGKTALVVRYLTKRYIGDYISGTDIAYKCELSFMRRQIEVQIKDTSGDMNRDSIMEIAKEYQADGDVLMLVYAMNDMSSLRYVEDVLREISEVAPRASILVVGNKSDLSQSSAFLQTAIKKMTAQYSFTHMTVSAKSSCADASRIFSKSIALVIKKRTFQTCASSADLTIYNAEKTSLAHIADSKGFRGRRCGASGAKLTRRATVDCGLTIPKTERRPSERLPSVEDTIEEEVEERWQTDCHPSPRDSKSSSPQNVHSVPKKKQKKVPPSSITLSKEPHESFLTSATPMSAPLPQNRMPVFRFPDVSCAAEYRYASLPTSPDNVLKRQNSFLNKLKGALTAVPQRLKSPK